MRVRVSHPATRNRSDHLLLLLQGHQEVSVGRAGTTMKLKSLILPPLKKTNEAEAANVLKG